METFFVVSSHMTSDGLNLPCNPWPQVSSAHDGSWSGITVEALWMEQNCGRVMFDWRALCEEEVNWLYDYLCPYRSRGAPLCGLLNQPNIKSRNRTELCFSLKKKPWWINLLNILYNWESEVFFLYQKQIPSIFLDRHRFFHSVCFSITCLRLPLTSIGSAAVSCQSSSVNLMC